MKTNIKDTIKSARLNAKLSQEELARILNISVFTLSRWENNNQPTIPKQIWVDKILEICGNFV